MPRCFLHSAVEKCKHKTLFPVFVFDVAPSWCVAMKMTCSSCQSPGGLQCKWHGRAVDTTSTHVTAPPSWHQVCIVQPMLSLGQWCHQNSRKSIVDMQKWRCVESTVVQHNEQRPFGKNSGLLFLQQIPTNEARCHGAHKKKLEPSWNSFLQLVTLCGTCTMQWRHLQGLDGGSASTTGTWKRCRVLLVTREHLDKTTCSQLSRIVRTCWVQRQCEMWPQLQERQHQQFACLLLKQCTSRTWHECWLLDNTSTPMLCAATRGPTARKKAENTQCQTQKGGLACSSARRECCWPFVWKKHIELHCPCRSCVSVVQMESNWQWEPLESYEELKRHLNCNAPSIFKFVVKQLCEPNAMMQRLDDWFCKCMVTYSHGSRPAWGRSDPCQNVSLFTSDTKSAVKNCKQKAIH